MASNYPGSLDSFDTIASDKKTSDAVGGRTHRAMHNDLGDAIEAVQTELGTDPSGGSATVKARFEVIEANDWVTAARIAADAVGSSEIAADAVGSSELADNAVDTAAIADNAVTPAKLASTGRFVFPTGAANGYGFASGAVHLSGTGSPEGVVTAAPGSTWLQIGDAITVSGNLSWRKATGTGNAGWIAEGALADTGWRDISGDLQNSWTVAAASSFRIRRIGNVVQLRAHVSGGTLDATIYSIPQAFRPTYTQYFLCADYSSGAVIGGGYYAAVLVRSQSNAAAYPDLTYFTDQAWPTSLPGS